MLKIVTDEQFLSKFTELNSLVKAMISHLGHNLAKELNIITNEEEYKYTFLLKALDGSILSSYTIDLPLESVVVNGTYDEVNKSIVLTLKNGNKIVIPIENVIDGLATKNQLDAEAQARQTADNEIKALVTAEAATRSSQDNALSGRITAEAATRQQKDEELQKNIDDVPFFVGTDGYIYGKD